jgi:predicted DNA-binding antitoxin AbrB/MazE fold protein
MTTTVRAVYENGVLRPARPLDLHEGEAVDLTVASRKMSPEEWDDRIAKVTTFDEWMELANSCPEEWPAGYDVVKAMNETRRANGERLLTMDDEPELPQ